MDVIYLGKNLLDIIIMKTFHYPTPSANTFMHAHYSYTYYSQIITHYTRTTQ